MNKLEQIMKQSEIEPIDWNKDQIARLWVETSLRLETLEKPEIIATLSQSIGKSENAIRIWYYRHLNPHGFEQYWMDKFTEHHKKRLAPRGYARLSKLVDKEKDIGKVIQAIDKAEGKEQAPSVQVNTFIKNEKNTYGI